MELYSYRAILPCAGQMSMRPISPYCIYVETSLFGDKKTAKIFAGRQEFYTIRSQSDSDAAAPALLSTFPAPGGPYALRLRG